jgi:hypothetical protein
VDLWRRPPASSRRGQLAYFIDRALAHRLDPSQTLVISGFWRSGTTWLEEALREILNAKTLFEPCDPLAREMQAVHASAGVERNSYEALRLFMPYSRPGTMESAPLREMFGKALRSESWGSWLRRFRTGLAESLKPRLVVKFVRAQLCLRAAQDTFGMPVLHVYRDPRAVIASVRKTRWHWLFDHLSLREQLLDPRDGRAAYFERWRDAIEEYDQADAVARLAAYWALSEAFLRDSYRDEPERFVCVGYEKLVQQREGLFGELLARLKLKPWSERFAVSQRDSTTTSHPQRGVPVGERVGGWKKVLSGAEIAMIESVMQRFDLEDRLASDPGHAGGDAVRHGV